MKKLLKCKKGMTMIEIIAGIMIFAILALTVSAILVPMLKVFVRSNDLAECNTLLDNLANEMVNDLSKATAPLDPQSTGPVDNIDFMSITTGLDTIEYSVDDGVLMKGDGTNAFAVLTKDFYKKKSVSFYYTFEGSVPAAIYMYKLTVIISSEAGEMVRRNYAVRPLALIQY